MKGPGAPTKYSRAFNKQATKLCLLGATDKDLADFFEVTEQTINNWKREHPSFFESIKKGKVVADMNVGERLYTRAMGYRYKEVTKEKGKNGKLVVTKEITKEQPPDPASIFFYLKNRKPKQWRDKVEHGFTDGDGNDVPTRPDMTFEQLMQLKYGPNNDGGSQNGEDTED